MSLLVWLPLTDNTENQGLLSLPTPWESRFRETGGKIGQYCYTDRAIYHLISEPLNNQWSIACWVKSTSWSANNDIIICKNSSESTNCQFYFSIINGASLNLGINGGAGNGAGSQAYTFSINTWYHVAATYDGSNYAMYVNGDIIKSGTYSSTMPSGLLNIGIGCRSTSAAGTSSTGNANKRLNDVRIYDECLSPLEIKRLSQGLIVHYPLNDSYIESTTNLITTEDCLSNTCYNGATSKYSYGTTTDMYKEVTTFDGKKGTKVYMGTDGLAAYPYVYVNNMYTSDGTNSPAYKTLSFDYYTTISTSISPYKLGSGTGTATYKVTNNTGTKTGTGTNSVTIPVVPYTWNHVEVIFHGTTEADSQWGYIQNRPSHTSDTSNFWFFANMQLETKDHATPYAGVGGNRDEATIYDCSGYCHNGEKIGAVTTSDNAPRYLTSTHITNGASTRIATPSLTLPFNAITLNIWFRSTNTSPTGNYHMVVDSVANRQWYEMCINNTGYLRAGLVINGTRYADNCTTKTALNGDWHMLTMTYDGTIIKRYFDGVMEKSTNITATTGLSSPTAIMLGRDGPSASYACIDTDLSDFRIYATALSADDVKALYENSAYIATDGTMYAYDFVES